VIDASERNISSAAWKEFINLDSSVSERTLLHTACPGFDFASDRLIGPGGLLSDVHRILCPEREHFYNVWILTFMSPIPLRGVLHRLRSNFASPCEDAEVMWQLEFQPRYSAAVLGFASFYSVPRTNA
jgi:hypothetical protein